MSNETYYTNRLRSLTPELADDERAAMFGERSTNEKAQICLMLLDTTQTQRGQIYGVLRSWMSELANSN